MKILILENGFNDLKHSRYPLGSYFESFGNEVLYACSEPKERGVFNIHMSRNSLAPFQIIQGCFSLNQLECIYSIEAVFSFRLIPNILNYLASFGNKDLKRVAVITGLGYAFTSKHKSIITVIQRYLIRFFYRIASNKIQIVAQNPDDLIDLGVKNGKVVLGSGLKNIESSIASDLKTDSIRLLYVGRLLKSKGILTAIDIFEKLKKRNVCISLTIAGTVDLENPDSLCQAELFQLQNKEGINYLGYVDNMNPIYQECNVLLFPSVYREGIPRVIIESLRYGLTIVTKDMPGCKETVWENGFLIKDDSIKDAVEYISNIDEFQLLANKKSSITLFKTKFCSDVVYPQYLSLLEK